MPTPRAYCLHFQTNAYLIIICIFIYTSLKKPLSENTRIIMCDKEKVGLEELEPMAIFGFDGRYSLIYIFLFANVHSTPGLIANGLHIHPDRMHIIFPLGNKVSIMNMATYKQQFLCGHTNTISNIDVSKSLVIYLIIVYEYILKLFQFNFFNHSGALIASGQINHIGFRAYVIIWDWATKSEKVRHELHKV